MAVLNHHFIRHPVRMLGDTEDISLSGHRDIILVAVIFILVLVLWKPCLCICVHCIALYFNDSIKRMNAVLIE